MDDAMADGISPVDGGGGEGAHCLSVEGERELVRRAQADARAFGELYERHYAMILNYLYRRTLCVAVAEELTSNTFFKALRGLGGFGPRGSIRFRSWLYRIATNEVRMHWRKMRRGAAMVRLGTEEEMGRVVFFDGHNAEEVREKERRFAAVHEALGRLPQKYQTAVALRYFEGLGPAEIGQVLGKREGTVKSLIHRGLARLAKIVEADATDGTV